MRSAPARAVHQFVPTAEPGAVGTHMLHLQRLVREELGVPSEIYAEHRRGPFVGEARTFTDYRGAAGEVLIYQMAIGSAVADFVAARAGPGGQRLVLNHHNLTPVRYLRPWDPGATFGVDWGMRQLHELASRTDLAIGASRFNQLDLVRAGYARTAVAPVLFDLDELASEPDDPGVTEALRGQAGAAWLFVGRVAANKCQHHLVRALAVYRRLYDPEARLYLVGGPRTGAYVDALRSYARELGLERALTLTGPVTASQLAAYYRHSDVFVCLSEHEGFCVPLAEAMRLGLPVVTGDSSAIPETVGDAGLVLSSPRGGSQPSAATVAAAVARVTTDPTLRAHLVAAGQARAEQLGLPRTRQRMLDALAPVVASR